MIVNITYIGQHWFKGRFYHHGHHDGEYLQYLELQRCCLCLSISVGLCS